jgi:hypothetical protein
MVAVIFLPLVSIYAYRAFHDKDKLWPKVGKGINYFFIGLIVLHGVFGSITASEFGVYIILSLFMLGLMELAYHGDVLLDIKDSIRTKLARNN